MAVGGLILKELFSDDEIKFNDVANSHNQFLRFEQAISLSTYQKIKIRSSKNALQNKIRRYFKSYYIGFTPKFFIQGSYKMKTMIVKEDGTYDVDLGIYFLSNPFVTPLTLQTYVKDAVRNHTSGGVEHRNKCLRIIYLGEFNIDLPVYYKTLSDLNPYLATKTNWEKSDPKELCDWYELQKIKKDMNGQMTRLIKYFKKWSDRQRYKMPSGIAFTVWAAIHYKPNIRDDISFYETAKSIYESFFWQVKCINPVTPGDDFLAKLTNTQKSNFKIFFKSLIENAETALNQDDQLKAARVWKGQFGVKFPLS